MPNKGNAPARIAECHPDRRHLARGLCKPCYDKQRDATNRDKRNAAARKWAAANPEKRSAIRRKYLYGIDHETVAARFKAQDGLCKICLDGPAAHLDHNHKTGKTRGLLCGNCNRALGLLREDPERIARAIAYLALWDDRAVQVIANTGKPVGHSTRGLS